MTNKVKQKGNMNMETLDSMMGVRVNKKRLEAFRKHCEKKRYEPNRIIREMMSAFIEGRLKIEKTKDQKEMEDLYVD